MKRNIAIIIILTLLLAFIHPALGETVLAQVDTETMPIKLVHSKTVRVINGGDPEVHEPGEWSGPHSAHFNYVGYDVDFGDTFEDESVLQFDLSSVSHKTIVSAVLKLDVHYTFPEEWGIWASNDNDWRKDEFIPEKTQLVKTENGMSTGINSIDVTSFFSSELYGSDQKATFVLSHMDPSKEGISSYFAFYTMGLNGETHPKQPILEVTYLANQPPTGQIEMIANEDGLVNDPNVSLWITGEDPDGDAMEINLSNSSTFAEEDWRPFSSPHTQVWVLVEGEGLNKVYMQLRDEHGNLSSVYDASVTLDTVKPTGSILVNVGAENTKDPAVQLDIVGTDASGIAQMRFSNQSEDLSSSLWVPFSTTYSWTLDTSSDGEKTVYMELQDKAGNISDMIFSNTIILDTKAPKGTLEINDGVTHTKDIQVHLTLTAQDDSEIEFIQMKLSNNNHDWTEWLPFKTSEEWSLATGEGQKTVYMKLRDRVGNESEEEMSADIYLDITPPTGNITINGGSLYTKTRDVKLSVSANDGNGVGEIQVQLSHDDQSWNEDQWLDIDHFKVEYDWQLAADESEQFVYMKLRDGLGHEVDSPIKSNPIILNTLPPVVTGVEHDGIYNSDVTITFNKGTATINGYSFLNGETVNVEGSYILIVTDAAGNFTKVEFKIDKTPPTGTVSINNGAVYTNLLKVNLHIEGQDSGTPNVIQMRFSNSLDEWLEEWEPLRETKSWTLDDNGMSEKTVYMQLRDEAGNVSSPISSASIIYKTIPVPLSSTVKGMETKAFVLKKSDFIYMNADGTELHSIKIAKLPADGEISLGNKKIDLGQKIIMSELDQEDLIFIPNQDWFGATELAWKAGNGYAFSDAIGKLSIEIMTVPTAPTDVKAVLGNGIATVKFNVPSNNGGSQITGYEVSDQQGNVVATGDSSPMTITGLTNGKNYTFTVKAINRVGKSMASEPSNEIIPKAPSDNDDNGGSNPPLPAPPMSPPPTKPMPNEINVDIIVNGQVFKAGIIITEMINNQQVTTITLDAAKLEQQFAEDDKGFVISIPWLNASDVVISTMSGQMVKSLEQKEAVVELITAHATYILPVQEIKIDAIAEQFGSNVALHDIEIQVEISTLTTEQLQSVERTAVNEDFEIVVPPLNFTVKGVHKGKIINISTFNAYIQRMIKIPNDVDPGKITTAIVIEPNGTVRHVPTKVEIINGQYTVIINSLSNSLYTLIWNRIEFQDVANHWAKDAINNMGARKIVNGINDQSYRPNQDITRAEYALFIVRALGLKIEKGTTPFIDVKPSDWYSGVVQTAYAHNLFNGFDDGTFRPNEKITREQAMVIISKAMEITKLSGQLQKQSPEQLLSAFNDATNVSTWAKSGVAACLQAGIVTGRSNGKLAPKDYITRAEAAVIIHRLLQKSGLI